MDITESVVQGPQLSSEVCPEYDERVRTIAAYRAKGKAGYVGLRNQGSTCYMNSLLQTLFMTPEFRHALLGWELQPGPDTSKNIPLQLQQLFSRLQQSEHGAVETKALTNSFGWTAADTFTQHDVQELNRVLFEAIQKYLERHKVEDFISRLYEGHMIDYIACQRCGGGRERLDTYQDIQVAVKGMPTVEAAIEAFSMPELLEGDNQWRCDSCGQLSDAKKGLRLDTTPQIFTIQLRRFDFDMEKLERVKIYDGIHIPLVLDVTPWIPAHRRAEDPEANLYDLFSVLLHRGSAHGGHYFAYIRNLKTDRWYNFNDESVDEITFEELLKTIQPEVVADAPPPGTATSEVGGVEPIIGPLFEGESRPTQTVTAQPYMLVYHARSATLPSYTAPVVSSLAELIAKENEEVLRLKEEYERVKDNLELKVFFTAVQGEECSVDLFKWIVVKNQNTVAEVLEAILTKLRDTGDIDATYPNSFFRVREYNENKHVFGRTFGDSLEISIEKLGWPAKKKLVLERKSAETEKWTEHQRDDLRLRALQYNVEGGVWKGRDVTVGGDANVADLRRKLSAMLEIPDDRLLISYRASPLTGVFLEPGIMLDRVLVTDLNMVPEERLYIEDAAECERTATGAYKSLGMQHIESVHFKTIRFNCLEEEEPTQCISFDVRRTFLELKAAIGQRLNVEPSEFRLKKSKKAQSPSLGWCR
eukprot:TRINITY_DN25687_c1_g1_i1.p1 TRINITY_DN25687_c1_g1~~TRINITY_DN25687_c1_g1_i1.p1  ORF type:complete len:729 (+),score=146.84 TRINITY_DN25687_c1_g1_i1:82-2187(+)